MLDLWETVPTPDKAACSREATIAKLPKAPSHPPLPAFASSNGEESPRNDRFLMLVAVFDTDHVFTVRTAAPRYNPDRQKTKRQVKHLEHFI
ncbi:hypothetical protein [Ensifer sp. LCM 4579]|uniref:hypothetical protein n=1 Tax=Ensifer sp. LCM 4579 TaxID=1848292 RepID=UPI001FCDF068|nr:hypothetical protein [Ensifer sp. LCM 4579]